ncbi:MAG: hypothetical protein LBC64_08115 [Fibromonadaceae bacterium]|jgi:hypothetical protein|nr:hypothetical protein [Fibromonadaceae bacterium]
MNKPKTLFSETEMRQILSKEKIIDIRTDYRENKEPVFANIISRLHDTGKVIFAVLNNNPHSFDKNEFFQLNRAFKFLDPKKFKSVLNGKKILHIAITLKNGVAK